MTSALSAVKVILLGGEEICFDDLVLGSRVSDMIMRLEEAVPLPPLHTYQLSIGENLAMITDAVVADTCYTAVKTRRQCEVEMDAFGNPSLGFLTFEHTHAVVEMVAEKLGEHARNLDAWVCSAAAATARDQPSMSRDAKGAFRGAEDAITDQACAHLFLFRTVQGYIAGAFRVGFKTCDPSAFVFSLVRPNGSGRRDESAGLTSEPVKLKVKEGEIRGAVYTDGGATACFGCGSTGKEDFDFNCLSPFVTSNLKRYGPDSGDPLLLFGDNEDVGGDRFRFKPDIMLAYQIPLTA